MKLLSSMIDILSDVIGEDSKQYIDICSDYELIVNDIKNLKEKARRALTSVNTQKDSK